jgi:hypothetical protein
MRARRLARALLAASALSACGGRINLGERLEPAPTGDGDEPVGPDAPVGKLVAQLTSELRVDLMAVTNDFLYVGNFDGLSRCSKANCVPTLERLSGVGSSLDHVQVNGQSLGVGHNDVGQSWLAAYSLPAGAEERVVLRNLPEVRSAYWHGQFVYWGLSVDSSVYRCRLPSCAEGPERLGSFVNLRTIQVDGEHVFWNDDSFIYRSSDFGAGPVATLVPDELLSEARVDPDTEQPSLASSPDFYQSEVQTLAVTAGKLYASLGELGLSQSRASLIVRWPVEGGPREQILGGASRVEALFLFGAELVWADSDGLNSFDYPATLWSCLADSCDATRRKLGYVVGGQNRVTVTANDTDLYWLEAGPNPTYPQNGSQSLINGQIRRAPRLSPGDP